MECGGRARPRRWGHSAVCVFVAGFLMTSLVIYALQYKHSHDTQQASFVRDGPEGKGDESKGGHSNHGQTKRESMANVSRKKRSSMRARRSDDVVVVFDFDETLGCFRNYRTFRRPSRINASGSSTHTSTSNCFRYCRTTCGPESSSC